MTRQAPPAPPVFDSADGVTRLLLNVATLEDRTAEAFVGKLFDIDKLTPLDRVAVYQAVRQAIASMPLRLWPENGMQQRQNVLAKFDQLAADASRGKTILPERQATLEDRLRGRLETSLKPF